MSLQPTTNTSILPPAMFCLRAWVPLLFLPTNASPVSVYTLCPHADRHSQDSILKSFCSFVVTFFVVTYFLNRPCICTSNLISGKISIGLTSIEDCSALLLILFVSSCSWRDQCLFDIYSDWFETKHLCSPLSSAFSNGTEWSVSKPDGVASDGSFLVAAINETASALVGAALEEMKSRMAYKAEWTGIGLGWMRSFLGAKQWRLPCVDVYVRL